MPVGDVVSLEPVTARAAESIDDALNRMRKHGIRRLPVVSAGGQIEGLVAFETLLRIRITSAELGRLVSLVTRQQTRERVARP